MKNPIHYIFLCAFLCVMLLPSCAMTEEQKQKILTAITAATTATVFSGMRQGLSSYDQCKSIKQLEKDVLSAAGKTATEQSKTIINGSLPAHGVDTTSGK